MRYKRQWGVKVGLEQHRLENYTICLNNIYYWLFSVAADRNANSGSNIIYLHKPFINVGPYPLFRSEELFKFSSSVLQESKDKFGIYFLESFNPYEIPVILSVYKRENWGSKGLSNLPKVTFLRAHIVFPSHNTVSVSETSYSLMIVMIIVIIIIVCNTY